MKFEKYVDKIKKIKNDFQNLTPIVEKCDQILVTIDAYQQQKLPDCELTSFELADDFIIDNLIQFPHIIEVSSELEDLRQTMIENLGIWHICNQLWINDLQEFCGISSHNIELMAGNAVISADLKNTIATDNLNWQGQDNERPRPWKNVEKLDAMAAVKQYYQHVDNIILAWAPDQDEIDWRILQFLRKNKFNGNFIVIGEKNGATNSPAFWKNAKLTYLEILNQHHKQFDFIDDKVWLVK